MGGNATPSFGGALGGHQSMPGGIAKVLCHVHNFCSSLLASTWVTARPPLSAGLVVALVLHVPFMPRAYLMVLPTC
jgi:hypothetical protein